MAATASPRKSLSIHDYPEHLNPFYEDDNHNKIRFWTLGKKLTRSNSITFSGIKDLKNSWAFRSFMKKGKKNQEKSSSQANGETSPIVYRRAMQYSSGARSTVASPERYVYGGSVTPLPRSRFQERLRSTSTYDANSLNMTPRMARSEVTGSRLSVTSTNPFEEDEPVPPVRAARRKKKRAPPPPPLGSPSTSTAADISIGSETSELHISEIGDQSTTKADGDNDLDVTNIPNIELKIVEDDDLNSNNVEANTATVTNESKVETITVISQVHNGADESKHEEKRPENKTTIKENIVKESDSEEDILNSVSFPKVDIHTYRRNSSVNEDDIRLRRGNLEDFHTLNNKRSKSLNNNLDTTYMTYDINLNEDIADKDTNGNHEPQRVICKYDETARKQSIDTITISSTEKEFMEIDKATRELEREISKLNSALNEDDIPSADDRLSVEEIKRRFEKSGASSPNPIPKPRRSHYGSSNSP